MDSLPTNPPCFPPNSGPMHVDIHGICGEQVHDTGGGQRSSSQGRQGRGWPAQVTQCSATYTWQMEEKAEIMENQKNSPHGLTSKHPTSRKKLFL